jgi:hypothetical protein
VKTKERKKQKIEPLISKRMILSNMNKSLVGIRDQQLETKDFNVIPFFSFMCEDLM